MRHIFPSPGISSICTYIETRNRKKLKHAPSDFRLGEERWGRSDICRFRATARSSVTRGLDISLADFIDVVTILFRNFFTLGLDRGFQSRWY